MVGRTRWMRRWAAVGVLAFASASLAGCGSDSSDDSSSGGDKTLVVENSFDLTTADPGQVYEITGGMVVHSMYEPLLGFEGADLSTPIPVLAKSFEVSEDGTTITLPLRDDVTFSDGTPLTSADVVFSFNRVKNLKGNPAFLLDGVTPSAPDKHTVVLTSKKPNPGLPYVLANPALGIQNSAVVKEHGGTDAEGANKSDEATEWLNANSAGSGPYLLENFSTTSEVTLEANPDYWGGQEPAYTKVVIRNVTADVQKLDIQKGEAQLVLDLAPAQAEGLPDSVEVHKDATSNTWFMFANKNPEVSSITSNPDFQDAIRYGLDYDALVDLAGEGSVRAPGIVATMFVGALDPSKALTTDVEKAKASLAASGYDGEKVEMEYPSDLTKNGVSFGTVAQRVQSQLSEIGINIELVPAPLATSLPNYLEGKEQLGLWLWGADYPDASNYLAFLPGQSVGLRAGWEAGDNPSLDALGEQAATTIDNDARAALYQQIQEQMNVEGPFMPLFQTAQVAVTAESLTGFVYNLIWTVDFASLG